LTAVRGTCWPAPLIEARGGKTVGFHSPVLTLRCKNNINMKTKTKQPNPLGACGADNNPRRLFKVEIHRTDYLTTVVETWAKSSKEAKAQAIEIAEAQDRKQWQTDGTDLYVFDAEKVKEGGRHV
jgi:hypothetical protein